MQNDNSFSFQSLNSYRDRVDTRIKAIVRDIQTASLREAADSLLSAGKRVRPLVTLLACEACGGKAEEAVAPAVGVELLHTASLIHDDIMDQATLRRGQPTLHSAYGLNLALVCGDLLVALAYEQIFQAAASVREELLHFLNTTYRLLCEGQALEESSQGLASQEERQLEIIRKKTASLMELAACAGALSAGKPDLAGVCKKFGGALGTAFQIQDDILDLTGEEKETGKDKQLDLRNQKMTFARAATAGSPRDIESQLAFAVSRSEEYLERALEALRELPAGEGREKLTQYTLLLGSRRS